MGRGSIIKGLLVSLAAISLLAVPVCGEEILVDNDNVREYENDQRITSGIIKAGVASFLNYTVDILGDDESDSLVSSSEESIIVDNIDTIKENNRIAYDLVENNELLQEISDDEDTLSLDISGSMLERLNSDSISDTIEIPQYAQSAGDMYESVYYAKVENFTSDSRYKGGAYWNNCLTYGNAFSNYMFGIQHYSYGDAYDGVNNIRTGDVIRIGNDEHTVVILRRSGEELWTAEGNYGVSSGNHNVRIEIGYKIIDGVLYQFNSGNRGSSYRLYKGYHLVNVIPDICCEMDSGIDKVKEGEYVIASALSLDDNNKIRKNRPYVLDVDDNDAIVDRTLNGKSAIWEIESEGDRFYSIKHKEKNKVMSLEERNKERKTNINICKWYDGDCESLWAFDEKWTGKYIIQNKHSGMCATRSDGDSVKQKEFYGKNDDSVDEQTWLLVRPDKPTIKTGSLPNGEVGKKYNISLNGSCDEWIAIEWSLAADSASLPAGLTLSEEGVLSGTPTKSGKYTIKVAATNEFGTTTADYSFEITGNDLDPTPVLVTGISLDRTSIELDEGNSATIKATVAPSNAENKKLSWKSDNENVATVDETGKVTAVSEGTATITASSTDGSNKSASCNVTVTSVKGIVISVGAVTGAAGSTVTVPVRITGNTGLGGMALTVTSDPALTLTGIERGNLLTDGTFNADKETGLVQWYTSNEAAKGDGLLCTLKFNIKAGTADGSYAVNIAYKDGLKENITDEKSVTLNVTLNAGSVKVQKVIKGNGDVIPDGVVAMGDVLKVARAVAGSVTLTEEERTAADVTGDGDVAMGDVVMIARFVAGYIKEF